MTTLRAIAGRPGSPAPTATRLSLAIAGLFVLAVSGAWAWFHVAPPRRPDGLRLSVRPEVPGWRWEPLSLTDQARATLATTNLFNGTFHGPRGEVVTAFAAEWFASSGHALSVVQHTPDLCWVGAGWVPVNLGQPARTELELAGRRLEVECRVFGVPGGRQRELVVWCTLVGGQVLAETERWRAEDDPAVPSHQRFDAAARRLGAGQLLRNIAARRAASGNKQFVRLSAPVGGDWAEPLDLLRAFAPLWLAVEPESTESHGTRDRGVPPGVVPTG